uniref:Ovule protein n=1 Tax=Ascaris lumbricoides TaxID=6252 RepID=A0A0M3IQG2_ASCLU
MCSNSSDRKTLYVTPQREIKSIFDINKWYHSKVCNHKCLSLIISFMRAAIDDLFYFSFIYSIIEWRFLFCNP